MRTIEAALFMIFVGAAGCSGAESPSNGVAQEQLPQKIVECGGFTGKLCSEGFTCVDNPDDSCNPREGGVDCGGICVQDPTDPPQMCGGFANIQCEGGQTCVDDPSDDCNPTKGGADCSGICVDGPVVQLCGGFGGLPCPDGSTCADNPNDDCDPLHGGADCGGICIAK